MYHHHHNHFLGLFSIPSAEWKSIREEKLDIAQFGFARLSILAAVPALSFFFGITQLGWSLSGSEFNQVATADAIPMSVGFYLAIIVCTLFMTYCTYWMEKTFGTEASYGRCLLFVTYTATPMYMAGLIGFAPIVWLVMLVLMSAVFYSLYLLYLGVPIYMNIPEGKGFIVSTSIISAGLCTLVSFIVATVIIWSMSNF
jgi:Yip1-like protein